MQLFKIFFFDFVFKNSIKTIKKYYKIQNKINNSIFSKKKKIFANYPKEFSKINTIFLVWLKLFTSTNIHFQLEKKEVNFIDRTIKKSFLLILENFLFYIQII